MDNTVIVGPLSLPNTKRMKRRRNLSFLDQPTEVCCRYSLWQYVKDEAFELRTLKINSEQFELWKLTYDLRGHNFFSCFNSHIVGSNGTVLLLCPSGPLHPKLGLTTLIVNNLFTRNPNLEEQVAYQLGIVRTEYQGRQCSKLLSCSTFLKEVVPSSDHPLVECLEALHRVVVGVFGQIVDP